MIVLWAKVASRQYKALNISDTIGCMNQTSLPLKSISNLIRESYAVVRKHIHILALIAAIPFVFSQAHAIIVNQGFDSAAAQYPFALLVVMATVGIVLAIIGIVLSVISAIVMVRALQGFRHIQGVSQTSPAPLVSDVPQMYSTALKEFFPYTWIIIIFGIVLWGGFVALIIPGIIVMVYFSFILFTYTFENKRGFDTLIMSARLVRGRWTEVFHKLLGMLAVITLSSIGIGIAIRLVTTVLHLGVETSNFLANLLSVLLITPFFYSYMYALYHNLLETVAEKSLQNLVDVPASVTADKALFEKKTKRWIIVFGIVAIVGTIAGITALVLLYP